MTDLASYTLIGDIAQSRAVFSRPGLQQSILTALHAVNNRLAPLQPLEPTLGDEFQGAFGDFRSALRATLLLRLELLKRAEVDSRFGLGYGPFTVFEERSPLSQDGPGWWSARAAIERTMQLSTAGRTEFVRTCFAREQPDGGPLTADVEPLNALLFCRDAIVTRMRPRSRRLLLGLLLERSQSEVAKEEKVSQSAVSQDLAASGAYAVEASERELAGAMP